MNTKYIFWLFLIFLAFAACNDIEDIDRMDTAMELPVLTSGTVDFSNYVAIGASFTAGFTDNALFIASQQNSFPNMLSQKFALVGGGDFTQPLTDDNIGGLLLGGNVIQNPRLFFNGSGPQTLPGVPTTEVSNVKPGPYNNMGVPGAKSFHLLANGYGNVAGVALGLANPYFARMASSPNVTVLADAVAQNPTFFTLSEIAGNDVLGYAISGGTGVNQLGNFDPSTYGSNDITDPNVFAQVFSATVTALTANGAKGVVANIPSIKDLPHFTTVPYNPLSPLNPAFGPQIPTLNAIFSQLNQVFAFLGVPERSIVFSETAASAVVIKDENLANVSAQISGVLMASPTFPDFLAQLGLPPQAAPLVANLLGITFGQARQATADDLFVLPSSSIIGTVNEANADFLVSQGLSQALADQFSAEGITLPLADKWVLIPGEQNEISTATNSFNSIIKSVADQAGVAFFDTREIMEQLAGPGVSSGNFILNANLVTGGAVSLDGIHLTARGYALFANEFLKAIDTKYGSNFEEAGELLDIGDFPTNYNPALQ